MTANDFLKSLFNDAYWTAGINVRGADGGTGVYSDSEWAEFKQEFEKEVENDKS